MHFDYQHTENNANEGDQTTPTRISVISLKKQILSFHPINHSNIDQYQTLFSLLICLLYVQKEKKTKSIKIKTNT